MLWLLECCVKCYDECDTSRISVDHGRTGTTQPPPYRLPAIDLRIHPQSVQETQARWLGIQTHSDPILIQERAFHVAVS